MKPSKYNSHVKRHMSLEDRLNDAYRVDENGCWIWTPKAVTSHGYGRMSYGGKVHRAHRLSAYVWLGLDLGNPEIKVCHTCDVPACINPKHLYLGTQETNVRDMTERGRGYRGPDKWTHCAKGHEMKPPNLMGKKRVRCRTCSNSLRRASAKRQRHDQGGAR